MMLSLCANDIMNREVLFAYEGWSIKRLAGFFINHKISGAPVVASDHELVGVVSVTDIFQFENMELESKVKALQTHYQSMYGNELILKDLETWSSHAENSCTVHQIMRKEVISVAEDTPVREVCRLMLERDIHRVFVTSNGLISGVITTSNILAAIVKEN